MKTINSRLKSKDKNKALNKVIKNHIELLTELNPECYLIKKISDDKKIIKEIISKKTISESECKIILSYGEVWSAQILSYTINKFQQTASCFIDARTFLFTKQKTAAVIDYEKSKTALKLKHKEQITITTGFICTNNAGETVLLGRNGSDYSATIIAKLTEAKKVVIWSDVAGIFSADPNFIIGAQLIKKISITEANQLAKIGCAMLHEKTIAPILNSETEIQVRSSINPSNNFTTITQQKNIQHIPIISFTKKIILYRFINKISIDQIQEKLAFNQIYALGLWQNYCGTAEVACKTSQQELVEAQLQKLVENNLIQDLKIIDNFGLVAIINEKIKDFQKEFSRIIHRNMHSLFTQPMSLATITESNKMMQLVESIHQQALRIYQNVSLFICGNQESNQELINNIKQDQQIKTKFYIKDYFSINNNQGQIATITTENNKQVKCTQEELIKSIEQQQSEATRIIIIESESNLSNKQIITALNKGIHVISAKNNHMSLPLPLYKYTLELIKKRNVQWLTATDFFSAIIQNIDIKKDFQIKVEPKNIKTITSKKQKIDSNDLQLNNPLELRNIALKITRMLNFEFNIEDIKMPKGLTDHDIINSEFSLTSLNQCDKYILHIDKVKNSLQANIKLLDKQEKQSQLNSIIYIQQEGLQIRKKITEINQATSHIIKILQSTY